MNRLPRFYRTFQDQLSDYVRAIAWSPQGPHLAAISTSGEVALWSHGASPQPTRIPIPMNGADRQSAVTPASLDCLGFSATGQYLAVAGQAGHLWVWDLQAPSPQLTFERTYGSIWIDQLAWNPDCDHLAVGVGRQVQVWDIPRHTQIATFNFEASSVLGLTWHPGGQYLAVSGHGGVKVWDLQAPDQAPTVLEVPGASLVTAWSARGQYLASGNLDRTLSVLKWEHSPPWLMQGFPGKVSQIAWSEPQANYQTPLLAAACLDGITVWQREPGQAGNWTNRVLTEHQGFVKAIAFQPAGTRSNSAPFPSLLLASGGKDDRVVLWQDAQQVCQTLKGLKGGTACLAWHPSGRYLAGGGIEGEIVIWVIESMRKGFG